MAAMSCFRCDCRLRCVPQEQSRAIQSRLIDVERRERSLADSSQSQSVADAALIARRAALQEQERVLGEQTADLLSQRQRLAADEQVLRQRSVQLSNDLAAVETKAAEVQRRSEDVDRRGTAVGEVNLCVICFPLKACLGVKVVCESGFSSYNPWSALLYPSGHRRTASASPAAGG